MRRAAATAGLLLLLLLLLLLPVCVRPVAVVPPSPPPSLSHATRPSKNLKVGGLAKIYKPKTSFNSEKRGSVSNNV